MSWSSIYEVVTAVTTSIGGGTLVVYVFSRWLGQVWASRILEQDRAKHVETLEGLRNSYAQELEKLRSINEQRSREVQAELDRNVYVTKAYFDIELAALNRLWRAFKALQLEFNALRPMFSTAPANESHSEKTERLGNKLSNDVNSFGGKYNDALAALEDERPFYATEVWEEAEAARLIAARELHSIATSGDRFGFQWYIDGSKNAEEFGGQMHRLELQIRHRVQSLSIRESE